MWKARRTRANGRGQNTAFPDIHSLGSTIEIIRCNIMVGHFVLFLSFLIIWIINTLSYPAKIKKKEKKCAKTNLTLVTHKQNM